MELSSSATNARFGGQNKVYQISQWGPWKLNHSIYGRDLNSLLMDYENSMLLFEPWNSLEKIEYNADTWIWVAMIQKMKYFLKSKNSIHPKEVGVLQINTRSAYHSALSTFYSQLLGIRQKRHDCLPRSSTLVWGTKKIRKRNTTYPGVSVILGCSKMKTKLVAQRSLKQPDLLSKILKKWYVMIRLEAI